MQAGAGLTPGRTVTATADRRTAVPARARGVAALPRRRPAALPAPRSPAPPSPVARSPDNRAASGLEAAGGRWRNDAATLERFLQALRGLR